MTTIERRVAALETRGKDAPLTAAEQRQHMDGFYVKHGTTRKEVIEEYGSEADYAYFWMTSRLDTEPTQPEPDNGLTVAERYLAMLE